ncbi:MAG: type I phosphomannose isomerase catalytic subunit [Candidatus Fimenecus sp.]
MILKLRPALKDYLWGGTRLKTDFGLKSDLDIVAEGWMLSCHKDGENIIENGKYKDKTLSDAIAAEGAEILGTNAQRFDRFPILIKLIDAKKDLSIQVHPDNDYALRVEGEYGKTECWYILDCDEGAELIYGFKQKISKEEFKQRIADNTFLEVVNTVPVHKGDLFFIDAGTLHAIGKGILLAEIQQNSNSTYRVYDYGRLGADGKPRPLHTEKAVDVTNCIPPTHRTVPQGEKVNCDGYQKQLLTKCDLFTVTTVQTDTLYTNVADSTSFVSVLFTAGSGEIACGTESFSVKKGDSFFIAANSGTFSVKGQTEFLETRV